MAHHATTSITHDAFHKVGAALLTVWPRVAARDDEMLPCERAMMLDECGSDHKPLVELLLEIGRMVRPALGVVSRPLTLDQWTALRAPLVHKLVATRYLQPEVVQWAVDTWGRALGCVPERGPLDLPRETERGAGDAPARPRTVAARHAPARRTSAAPVPGANTNTNTRPSWAGGPVSFGIGAKPNAATLAALAQSGRTVVRPGPVQGPKFSRLEQRAAMVLGALLVVVAVSLGMALRERPMPAALTVDGGHADTLAAGAAITDTGAAVRAPVAQAPSTDTVLAAAAAAAADAAGIGADTRPAFRAALPGEYTMAVRDAGVAGAYLVTSTIRDVSGSESCDAVARALGAGRESREQVAHRAGEDRFALTTRGVTATLTADGWFVAAPRSGTTNNIGWEFRLRGRFVPDGFTATSETHTEAILRWGRVQQCVVTADLIGRRLPA